MQTSRVRENLTLRGPAVGRREVTVLSNITWAVTGTVGKGDPRLLSPSDGQRQARPGG